MRYFKSGLSFEQADPSAIFGEAYLCRAVTIEVKARSIRQRDCTDFADSRFVTIDAIKGLRGDDGRENEQQHSYRGGDHDITRQAPLLFFTNDFSYRGQWDVGGGAFQSLGCFPCGLSPGESDSMAGIRFDPSAKRGLVLSCRIAVEPGQQTRGFRLDLVPAA
jgi:hypothetical protein